MLRRLGIPLAAVLALAAGCGGSGSSATGDGSSGKGADAPVRTLATTCPELHKVLVAGSATPAQLRSLADATDALADRADLDTRKALTALPADARVLARSPGLAAAKTAFRGDVARLRQACAGAGSPIR
jgi:hypothetical protein